MVHNAAMMRSVHFLAALYDSFLTFKNSLMHNCFTVYITRSLTDYRRARLSIKVICLVKSFNCIHFFWLAFAVKLSLLWILRNRKQHQEFSRILDQLIRMNLSASVFVYQCMEVGPNTCIIMVIHQGKRS
jgi:hypothetical protein